MRIQDVSVESFGILRDLRMEGLPGGLSVILGRNEAGKSTLLDFFRATLTGYPSHPRGRDAAYLENGATGGSLTLAGSHGTLRLTRRPGPDGGILTLADAEGRPLEASVLEGLLGGVTRDIYTRIYGFGLNELQNLSTLTDSQIRNALYGAGFGSGLQSPGRALERLDAEMGRLFKPGGTRQPVALLLKEWESLGQRIREAQREMESCGELSLERSRLEQARQTRKLEREQLSLERSRLERRLSVWRQWEEWRELGVRLKRMPPVPATIPADAQSRLREATDRLEFARRQLDGEREKAARLQASLGGVSADETLLALIDGVRSASERKASFCGALTELQRLEKELARVRASLSGELASLGAGWTVERAAASRPTLAGRERLACAAKGVAEAQTALDAADSALFKAVTEAKNAKTALHAASWQAGVQENVPAESETVSLENSRKTLRELRGLAFMLPAEERRLADLRGNLQTHMARRPRVASQAFWLAAGFAITLGGVFLGASAGGVARVFTLPYGVLWRPELWHGAVLLLAGAGLAFFGLSRHRGEAARHTLQTRELRAGFDKAARFVASLRGKAVSLCASLGLDSLDAARLDELENRLERLREQNLERARQRQSQEILRRERERLLSQALESVETAKACRERAASACAENLAVWRGRLKEMGLDPEMPLAAAQESLRSLERALSFAAESTSLEGMLETRCEERDAFLRPVSAMLEAAGRAEPDADGVLQAFEALRGDVELAARARDEHRHLEAQLDRQMQDVRSAEAVEAEACSALGALLRLAETDSPEVFLARASIRSETDALTRTREELLAKLWLAGSDAARLERPGEKEMPYTEAQFSSYLAGFASADRDGQELSLKRLTERLAILEESLQRDSEALRRLELRLEALEHSDELAILRGRQESVAASLQGVGMEWARLALARRMLEKAKERFERERQPEVIRTASQLFALMTDGAWEKVTASLDNASLSVLPAVGTGVSPERLSRGTQEQLYLALRLAHVRQHARAGTPLPLIMDDIFVNFDPERTRQAANVLNAMIAPEDGSAGHQILFFTCHPHLADFLCESNGKAALFVMEHGRIRREGVRAGAPAIRLTEMDSNAGFLPPETKFSNTP